jgi:hypothetical protein
MLHLRNHDGMQRFRSGRRLFAFTLATVFALTALLSPATLIGTVMADRATSI